VHPASALRSVELGLTAAQASGELPQYIPVITIVSQIIVLKVVLATHIDAVYRSSNPLSFEK